MRIDVRIAETTLLVLKYSPMHVNLWSFEVKILANTDWTYDYPALFATYDGYKYSFS